MIGRISIFLCITLAVWASCVQAQTQFRRITPRYIAALGEPNASSGTGAEKWGLWRLDPGPRGVKLKSYKKLKASGGIAPARWRFDESDWWLEEHGLIMEKPDFPPVNTW